MASTLRIDVKIDDRQLQQLMQFRAKRLAYAVVNAINRTAKLIQATEREHVAQVFTVRKSSFIGREAAKIKFASVGKSLPFAEVYVGQKPRLLLGSFEKGGVKKPVKGRGTAVAVPETGGPARPSFGQPVVPIMRITALRLRKTRPLEAHPTGGRKRVRRSKSKDSGVRYGMRGTYQVPEVGIFQRQPGAEKSTLVYPFIDEPKLDDRLRFVETAEGITDTWFREFMEQEVNDVIERHR